MKKCSECNECWYLWSENQWGCHHGMLKEAIILKHDIYVEQPTDCPLINPNN